jgi:2-oxoglutarate ferredoxin oxidoreductase subunit alpha
VLSAEELEAGREFGRYLDVVGDGIPYRTLPGAHPTRGAYFTRGTSRDRFARYSEKGAVYQDNVERLLKKFDTAAKLVPGPVARAAKRATRSGVIYFGSTTPAMHEALEALEGSGHHLDALRVRAFPFSDEVYAFIRAHDEVFVVEQNRDAQLRTLIVTEGEIDPARLKPVVHFDGTPITARFLIERIGTQLTARHPVREMAE